MSLLHELGHGGLCQLIGVQVGVLLHQAQTLDHIFRGHAPAHAQAGKSDLRKTVDVNHNPRAIERLERGQRLAAEIQAGIDMIFDHGHLVARGQLQQPLARAHRHGGAGGALEIRRDHDELYAVLNQRGFQRLEIHARPGRVARYRAHVDPQAAHTRGRENGQSAGIRWVLKNHRIAGPQESFGQQIQSLLAARSNQDLVIPCLNVIAFQHLGDYALERGVPVGRAELENARAVVFQRGLDAEAKFLDRKQFGCRPGYDE